MATYSYLLIHFCFPVPRRAPLRSRGERTSVAASQLIASSHRIYPSASFVLCPTGSMCKRHNVDGLKNEKYYFKTYIASAIHAELCTQDKVVFRISGETHTCGEYILRIWHYCVKIKYEIFWEIWLCYSILTRAHIYMILYKRVFCVLFRFLWAGKEVMVIFFYTARRAEYTLITVQSMFGVLWTKGFLNYLFVNVSRNLIT